MIHWNLWDFSLNWTFSFWAMKTLHQLLLCHGNFGKPSWAKDQGARCKGLRAQSYGCVARLRHLVSSGTVLEPVCADPQGCNMDQLVLLQHRSPVSIIRSGGARKWVEWGRGRVEKGRIQAVRGWEWWQLCHQILTHPRMSWAGQHRSPWLWACSNVGTESRRPIDAMATLLEVRAKSSLMLRRPRQPPLGVAKDRIRLPDPSFIPMNSGVIWGKDGLYPSSVHYV